MIVTPYGLTKSGQPVSQYQLRSTGGVEVRLIDFGASVSAVHAPDRSGALADVTLGFDTLPEWEKAQGYLGATVGRFGNRIRNGRFTLDGRSYQVGRNDGGHSLHGGFVGFDKRVWTGAVLADNAVRFTYVSPDGEEGFPGTLTTEVTYTLGAENDLTIDYRLTTDAPTIVNVTNHSYFNLAGEGAASILDHELTIAAGQFVITDAEAIPTGELPSVEGTPMDFRVPTPIGARIDADFAPLVELLGYDHTYVLAGEGLRRAAEIYHPTTGRTLTVLTTEPGVQFYSGNYLEGAPGKGGKPYAHRSGLCLETQHYPDSPNHPEFPSTVLRPGEVRASRTIYRFSAR